MWQLHLDLALDVVEHRERDGRAVVAASRAIGAEGRLAALWAMLRTEVLAPSTHCLELAARERLVVQIPIAHKEGLRAYAYPEHVSGGKKPGQHESMHGTAEQKMAFQAAVAAAS